MTKTLSLLTITAACVLAFSAANANAQTEPVPAPQTSASQPHSGGGKHHKETGPKHTDPSCQQIQADCKEAGYIVGQWKKDNGLWKDCFDRIIKGETPTRYGKPDPMKVDPNVVGSCKAAMGHHKHRKGSHKNASGSSNANALQTTAPVAAR